MIDGIDLGSLNKIEINSHKDLHEGLKLVDLLFRCNAKVQQFVINYKASGTLETELCEIAAARACRMLKSNSLCS